MNTVALLVATYVITGIALTAYDLAAPPLHAKFYVVERNRGVAFRNWFLWPLSLAIDVANERRFRRRPLRLLRGALLLFIGVLVVVRFIFLVSALFISWSAVPYILAAAGGILVSPIVVALSMPKHGESRHAVGLHDQ